MRGRSRLRFPNSNSSAGLEKRWGAYDKDVIVVRKLKTGITPAKQRAK